MAPYWTEHFMLPGQEHPQAHAVGDALEVARQRVAQLVGCDAFEIVFTGSGTEANNLAVLGAMAERQPGHILVSALEHESVSEAANSLLSQGWEVESIPCQPCGLIDPQRVQDLLRPDTRLVCLQAANATLGTLQPVWEVADLCHQQGVAVHCDATQVFGKSALLASQLRADSIAISGHKFYGPKGAGALYRRRGYPMRAIQYGQSREMHLRPGPENMPAWIGLGAAAYLAHRCTADAATAMAQLRDRLAAGLEAILSRPLRVICEESPRLPNTLTIELPADAKRVQRAARELVLATSMTISPADEITRSLLAIGDDYRQISRTLRLSLGWTTSDDQIQRAIQCLAQALDTTTDP